MDERPTMAIAAILAGGAGLRMESDVPKTLLEIQGRSILDHSLRRIIASGCAVAVVIVASGAGLPAAKSLAQRVGAETGIPIRVIGGGETRFKSGCEAIRAIREETARGGLQAADVVLFHDAARPCVPVRVVRNVAQAAQRTGAALAAIPVDDTIKRASGAFNGRFVESTIDRKSLFRAQTPQAFRFDIALDVFARAEADGYDPTDDAQLAERYGIAVELVAGDARNIKVTRPDDLALAEFIMKSSLD
jgi:2-C-methyl-D-erythritol 4-phosphate cytidylyltransferase